MQRFMIEGEYSFTMILEKDERAALIRFLALCILSEEELEQMPGYRPGCFAASNLLGGSFDEWVDKDVKDDPASHGGELATTWSGRVPEYPVVNESGQYLIRLWPEDQLWWIPSPYTVENFYRRGFTIVEQPDVVMLSFLDG